MEELADRLGGIALDTTEMLHRPMVTYYENLYQEAVREETYLNTRFEQIDLQSTNSNSVRGDEIIAKLNDLFYNGLGIQWSTTQQKIFNAFVDSCLPRIYGAHWESVKSRVMRKRKLDNTTPWVLGKFCSFVFKLG